MAGHSHASNIKHRKAARDAKKSSQFTKIVQKIISSAKISDNPDNNPSLRVAIQAAHGASVPKSTIENALEKARKHDEIQKESVRYNISLGTIAVIVEAITDNKSRTASEVRAIATKRDANLVETGALEFMFDYIGLIIYQSSICNEEEIFSIASDLNCNDFEFKNECYFLYTEKQSLHDICNKLIEKYQDPLFVDLIWKPKNLIDANENLFAKAYDLIEDLRNLNDIQDVFANFFIDNEEI